MRKPFPEGQTVAVRNCERCKMLYCNSTIDIDKRNMMGPETSDYNLAQKRAGLNYNGCLCTPTSCRRTKQFICGTKFYSQKYIQRKTHHQTCRNILGASTPNGKY